MFVFSVSGKQNASPCLLSLTLHGADVGTVNFFIREKKNKNCHPLLRLGMYCEINADVASFFLERTGPFLRHFAAIFSCNILRHCYA